MAKACYALAVKLHKNFFDLCHFSLKVWSFQNRESMAHIVRLKAHRPVIKNSLDYFLPFFECVWFYKKSLNRKIISFFHILRLGRSCNKYKRNGLFLKPLFAFNFLS